ncbi:hypothetical protein PT2222_30015 [Paraburkholderia tropica]
MTPGFPVEVEKVCRLRHAGLRHSGATAHGQSGRRRRRHVHARRCQRRPDRRRKPVLDRIDLLRRADERRREQHVVAVPAIDGPAHRIHHQPARERLALDRRMQLERRIEARLRFTVLHQLDADEQPTAAHVADIRMLGVTLAQPRAQLLAAREHVVEQFFLSDHTLHFERRRTGRGMADIGVAVLEVTAAAHDGFIDARAHERRADRLIAGAQTLRDGQQIGRDAVLRAGVQPARAAHARHDLVEDQQHAVAIAHGANLAEVVAHRWHRAGRRADHRLRHESRDVFRAEFEDLLFEFIGETLRVGFVGFAFVTLAIRVARAHVMRFDQDRQERLASPCVAADRQRAERIAVIALAARDEMTARQLALLHEELARELERGLDRLGPARDEIDVIEPFGRVRDQVIGELLGGVGREERSVRVRQLLRLALDRVDHALVAVTEARHGRAAARVDIALAGRIDDLDTLARHCHRQGLFGHAMKDFAHVRSR